MDLQYVVILCGLFTIITSQNIGDICEFAENETGECKIINACPYAMNLLYEDEVKPPMCRWEGDVRIVCCPMNETKIVNTGPLGRLFNETDGEISSNGMTCSYDGNLPMFCCPNLGHPQPAEPKECPKFRWNPVEPKFKNAVESVAWSQCLSYRRFVDVCVEDENKENTFKRTTKCNLQPVTLKISGGKPVYDYEFPHMAVLGYHNGDESAGSDIVWLAGGSLVSDLYILTAAHVIYDEHYGKVHYALLGTNNKAEVHKGILLFVVQIYPHKLYSTKTKQHDIALLRLHTRVKFSHIIHPICLPVSGMTSYLGANIRVVAGWGKTGADSPTSQHLLKAYVEEMDKEDCSKANAMVWNSEIMVCAKGVNGAVAVDTCPGDSGGPLMTVVTEIPCTYAAAGIVSFGPDCGEGSSGVYTNVKPHVQWIVEYIWPHELEEAEKSFR